MRKKEESWVPKSTIPAIKNFQSSKVWEDFKDVLEMQAEASLEYLTSTEERNHDQLMIEKGRLAAFVLVQEMPEYIENYIKQGEENGTRS